MKSIGHWLIYAAALIGLLRLGGIAGRLLMLLGELIGNLLLDACVLAVIYAVTMCIRATLTASARQADDMKE